MLTSRLTGSSSIITKKGLIHAEQRYGFKGEGFIYLKSPLWWIGTSSLVLGEICNFAAYAFAPAILVTPLGALSVLVAAILGSYFLNEELGRLGKLGSALCLIGAVIIILHAPPDEDIQTIDKILEYAFRPGFLIYALSVCAFTAAMVYRVAPLYGKKNPLVYVSICSLVGSVSIMAIKAFGIAVKLTLGGNNQFSHASTYFFMAVTGLCIFVQLNYLNKALSQFPTNIVNPLYYVTFTTGTICASLIFYGGFNTTDAVATLSLLCGFLVTFSGVYLLNLSRGDPDGTKAAAANRRGYNNMRNESRFSGDETRRSRGDGGRTSFDSASGGDREGLMHAYDEEDAVGFELDSFGVRKSDDNVAGTAAGAARSTKPSRR
ncbi:magnesium transporter NIPA-domain-containing protein [Xylariales sp. PMI_506]|nr:magnesium transporter NIPA-domain-containing protein [Xylariales sp. PMI_506]